MIGSYFLDTDNRAGRVLRNGPEGQVWIQRVNFDMGTRERANEPEELVAKGEVEKWRFFGSAALCRQAQ